MGKEKKPSIYSDRGTIGSSSELDEYGVWVKSEPQDMSTSIGDIKETETDDIEFPDFGDLPDMDDLNDEFSANNADDLFDDDFELPDLDTDTPDAGGDDSEEDGEYSYVSLEEFIGVSVPPSRALSDSPDGDDDADLDFELPDEQDIIFTSGPDDEIEEELPIEPGGGDLSTRLLMRIADELASIRQELTTLKRDFSGSRSSDAYIEEDDEKIALTGDELNNILITADFTEEETPIDFSPDDTDYLSTDPAELSDDSIDFSDAVIDEPDLASDILDNPLEEPSADDLSLNMDDFNLDSEDSTEISDEPIDELSGELSELGDFSLEEEPSLEEFSLEEEEVNLTDISFEDAQEEPLLEDFALPEEEPGLEELSLEEEPILEDLALEEEEPGLEELSLEEEPGLEDVALEEEEPVLEELALEEEPILEDLALEEEPGLEDLALEEEEPILEDISLEELSLDEEEPAESLLDRDSLNTEDIEEFSLEDDTLSLDDGLADNADELEVLDELETEDIGIEELASEELETEILEEETPSEEMNMSDFLSPMPEALISESEEELLPEEDLDFLEADEALEDLDEAEEVSSISDSGDSSGPIPSVMKEELKTVLSYMDQLLEALPDDKIEEFARSEHYDTYKKLFKELGLV